MTRFLRRPIHSALPVLSWRVLLLALTAGLVWVVVVLQLAMVFFARADISGTL